MTPEHDTAAANAAIIRDSFDAFNAGDTDKLKAATSPELITHYAELPEPVHGRDTWLTGFEMMKHAFPDLAVRIDALVAQDDAVAVRINLSGTHHGYFQGFPATGRHVHYTSHEFYRIADGLIAEEWICSDMASLMHQLHETP